LIRPILFPFGKGPIEFFGLTPEEPPEIGFSILIRGIHRSSNESFILNEVPLPRIIFQIHGPGRLMEEEIT